MNLRKNLVAGSLGVLLTAGSVGAEDVNNTSFIEKLSKEFDTLIQVNNYVLDQVKRLLNGEITEISRLNTDGLKDISRKTEISGEIDGKMIEEEFEEHILECDMNGSNSIDKVEATKCLVPTLKQDNKILKSIKKFHEETPEEALEVYQKCDIDGGGIENVGEGERGDDENMCVFLELSKKGVFDIIYK